jgi:hypothetical protein
MTTKYILREIYSRNLNKVDLYIQNVVVGRGSILKFKYHKKEISLKDIAVRLCAPWSLFIWKQ